MQVDALREAIIEKVSTSSSLKNHSKASNLLGTALFIIMKRRLSDEETKMATADPD